MNNNACYLSHGPFTGGKPSGFCIHDTGAPNTMLKRYIQPGDVEIGNNVYNNHWNTANPEGRSVCASGFIGHLNDGKTIATVQTLPWDMRPWLQSTPANNYYIGIEICTDGGKSEQYCRDTFEEAAQLAAMLCKMYNWNPMGTFDIKYGGQTIVADVITSHQDAEQKGLCNPKQGKVDPNAWWKLYGLSMQDFRERIRDIVNGVAKMNNTKPETCDLTAGDIINIASNAVWATGATIPAWVKNMAWLVKSVDNGGKTVVIDTDPISKQYHINSRLDVKYAIYDKKPVVENNAPISNDKLFKSNGNVVMYKGAGKNTGRVGLCPKGVFTIVEEKNGYGKLKSGAGWVIM